MERDEIMNSNTQNIQIKKLTLTFNKEKILHDINLTIPTQGITILLGRSGSGKTTLLRTLNRLNETYEGHQITGQISLPIQGLPKNINDIPQNDLPKLRQKVGMVFQTPNPLPISVRKNITLPTQLTLNMTKKQSETKAEETLKQVGLWEEIKNSLNKPAKDLSGGQQQRLCFARTLALNPEILLLDEPTASLDKKSSSTIENLILTLKNKIPIILVSHSLSQAIKLGDRYIIMNEGKIKTTIKKEELTATETDEKTLEKYL
ncbi:MAG: phosphate ABC transporter ATP-binding protein [Synergistaceae bacterium]